MQSNREQLLISACGGDAAAIEILLTSLQPDLKRFARRSCASSEDAEDAVQIALWKIQRNLGSLRAMPALASWLFRIVERECFRLFRAMRFHAPLTASLEDKLYSAPVPVQLRLDLVAAVASLPRQYMAVLTLRDIDELTAPETAQQLGISVAAVKTRLHRARGLMRQRLMQGQYWSGADVPD